MAVFNAPPLLGLVSTWWNQSWLKICKICKMDDTEYFPCFSIHEWIKFEIVLPVLGLPGYFFGLWYFQNLCSWSLAVSDNDVWYHDDSDDELCCWNDLLGDIWDMWLWCWHTGDCSPFAGSTIDCEHPSFDAAARDENEDGDEDYDVVGNARKVVKI